MLEATLQFNLTGKRIAVTGGSRGIGRAVAEAIASRGGEVVVLSRQAAASTTSVSGLGPGKHRALSLDVSSDRAWKAIMVEIDALGPLHGVVAAAGVLGPIGPIETVGAEEFRRTLEVNLLGTQLALHHCIPRLIETQGAAVTFSGGGATSPLARYDAYAASKAAVVRLTENVARVTAEQGVRVNSISPGFVATRMHEGTLAAGPKLAGAEYVERTRSQLAHGGVPASEAAELACFLLSADAEAINGKLISAPWDPWRDESFRARLRSQIDLATLRRIDEQFYFAADPPPT